MTGGEPHLNRLPVYLNRCGDYSVFSMSRVENIAVLETWLCGTVPSNDGAPEERMTMLTERTGSGWAYDTHGSGIAEVGLDGAVVSDRREQPPAEGERRLLLAIFEDAIRCYQKYAFSGTRRGRRLFRELETWFAGDPEATVTFGYICDVFGIDPDYVRDALARWRAHHYAPSTAAATGARSYDGEPIESATALARNLLQPARTQAGETPLRLAANG